MSFFKKLKMILNKPNEVTNTPLTYNLEEWLPNIKTPQYDKLFSLQEYLIRIDTPEETIVEIIESNNPFGKAKHLFSTADNVKVSEMFSFGVVSTERWIKLLSLWMSDPEIITGNVFSYLILKLGLLCDWNIVEQRAINPYGLDSILTACKQNDYSTLLMYVDNEVMSCFALAHLRSEKKLSEIVNASFKYLDMNTQYLGSASGSFYNLYGKETLKNIIGKFIEAAYTLNKFSLNHLFKNPPINIYNFSNLKYNVFKMNSIRGFYLPNPENKNDIIKDVFSLNQYINDALELIVSFPDIYIEPEDIVFRFDTVRSDEPTNFCTFVYNPSTPTGRISKYPLKLGFYCARKSEEKNKRIGNSIQLFPADGIHGEIEYLSTGEIGKARIIISYCGKMYIIHILDKKGEKKITKIEGSNDNNERIVLYNINQKQ